MSTTIEVFSAKDTNVQVNVFSKLIYLLFSVVYILQVKLDLRSKLFDMLVLSLLMTMNTRHKLQIKLG